MNRREFLKHSSAVAAAVSFAPMIRGMELVLGKLPVDETGQRYAEGYVFLDAVGNGIRGKNAVPLAGVAVSNGKEVVRTDRNGKYRLPVSEDSVLFVVKPAGYKVPLNENNLPQFYYIHKPKGSPKYQYTGVAPTGDLPTSIDFGLQPQKESKQFRMMLFGDPQPRNQAEVDFMAHDVIAQAVRDAARYDAKFGVSLGDIMFDVLSLYASLNGTIGQIGLPWYNVVGNHDLNFDAPDNTTSTETFQNHYGPQYYSFDYGQVHFVVLNDVVWDGAAKRGYHGEITKDQLEWLKNDLALVPKDKLVFVAMHIPLEGVQNREELFRLLEPFPHTFSASAHTHVQQHLFYGDAQGWKGKNPHHHLNHVTVCGCWWGGAPDERGIPHATMSDGVPNGYSIVEFSGNRYKVSYIPASRPESEQMRIWAPEEVRRTDTGLTDVVVNIYAGSPRSTVDMRLDDGEWKPMLNFQGQDPHYAKLKTLEEGATPPPGRRLPRASQTRHLWKAPLPSRVSLGVHKIEVRTTDMWGQTYVSQRMVRIV